MPVNWRAVHAAGPTWPIRSASAEALEGSQEALSLSQCLTQRIANPDDRAQPKELNLALRPLAGTRRQPPGKLPRAKSLLWWTSSPTH
jgi:hypothetical protein